MDLPKRVWRPLAACLASVLVVTAIAWALGWVDDLGFALYPQQFFAAILALALPVAYLTLPARRGYERETVPWYDSIAALLSFAATAYVTQRYPSIVNIIFSSPPQAYVPGAIIVVLLLEALRRATGWALVAIILVFLIYAMFGDVIPGRLSGRVQSWDLLAGYMIFDVNGILGLPMAVATTVIVAFIFFGNLLGATGGSKFFTDAAMLSMGRFRGGSMKIAVLASALFGSISGSAVANVVATGVVTIPMIKRDGYPAHKAGAIEAVASTGGQLMPPVMGAAAFLMAEFLAVPYSEVVRAALVPAILYYVALFIQADLDAARLGIARVPVELVPPGRRVMRGMHFVLAFALLIYALFVLRWQPERAALAAAVSVVFTSLLFGYDAVRPKLGVVLSSITQTGYVVIEIILISAAAGIVIGVLNITGLSFNLTYALVDIGGNNAIVLLVLSAIVCIVLGMGLPTLGVYALLAALVAPALITIGIEPIAAHLYVLYFGMMSMVTPPIAMAAFAAASVAQAPAMATGFAAMKFGWLAYIIPLLFVFSPTLILMGEPVEITLAVTTATLGVWMISAALAGFLLMKLALSMRLLLGLAGFAALIPAGAFPGAIYTDIAGVALGLALMSYEVKRARHQYRALRIHDQRFEQP